jgi:hypothetical protein
MSMNGNGTRKETKGWEISPSGQMVNIGGGVDGIVVEEGLPITDSAVVKTEPPPPPVMAKAPLPPPRERKTTLDTFNDELAVLDRPIEGDVEYEDEVQPPSRFRRVGLFAGIVVVMGLGGGLLLSRRHATVEAPAQASAQPAPPAATPTVLAAAAPAAAMPAPTPTPAAEPPAEQAAAPAPAADEGADEPSTDDEPTPAPAKRSAWSKVRTKSSTHSKHARSSGGKTTYRRVTTTTTHHSVKRVVRQR